MSKEEEIGKSVLYFYLNFAYVGKEDAPKWKTDADKYFLEMYEEAKRQGGTLQMLKTRRGYKWVIVKD